MKVSVQNSSEVRQILVAAHHLASHRERGSIECLDLLTSLLRYSDLAFLYEPSADIVVARLQKNLSWPELRSDLAEKVPVSAELRRVIEYAEEVAKELASLHIEPHHILLGLLRERGSAAYRLLVDAGLSYLDSLRVVKEAPRVTLIQIEQFLSEDIPSDLAKGEDNLLRLLSLAIIGRNLEKGSIVIQKVVKDGPLTILSALIRSCTGTEWSENAVAILEEALPSLPKESLLRICELPPSGEQVIEWGIEEQTEEMKWLDIPARGRYVAKSSPVDLQYLRNTAKDLLLLHFINGFDGCLNKSEESKDELVLPPADCPELFFYSHCDISFAGTQSLYGLLPLWRNKFLLLNSALDGQNGFPVKLKDRCISFRNVLYKSGLAKLNPPGQVDIKAALLSAVSCGRDYITVSDLLTSCLTAEPPESELALFGTLTALHLIGPHSAQRYTEALSTLATFDPRGTPVGERVLIEHLISAVKTILDIVYQTDDDSVVRLLAGQGRRFLLVLVTHSTRKDLNLQSMLRQWTRWIGYDFLGNVVVGSDISGTKGIVAELVPAAMLENNVLRSGAEIFSAADLWVATQLSKNNATDERRLRSSLKLIGAKCDMALKTGESGITKTCMEQERVLRQRLSELVT